MDLVEDDAGDPSQLGRLQEPQHCLGSLGVPHHNEVEASAASGYDLVVGLGH
jgi:hypothetical protein